MLRQNIEVTQDKKLVNPAIHVVQGDTGRTVVALVKDATISGTATMAFERPDGATYTTTATVNSDNSVEATFTADMLRVAGTGKATFKVVSSGSQVSTYQLYVLVEPSAGFERPVTPSNNKIYVYVNGNPVEVATATEVATKASQSQVDGISATVNNLVGRIVEDESNIAINAATLRNKMNKVRIDFDGTNFKIGTRTLNYKELYDIHISNPDFGFVVYGDRAYLLSYVQDGAGMKEMRFQSTIATTDSSNLSYTKTSGIYVTSSDGINIASVRVADINSENKSYKATEFTEANKNSDIWYPSNKAVNNVVSELKDDLAEVDSRLTESIIEISNNFSSDGSEYNMINSIYGNGYVNNNTGAIEPYNGWEYTDFIKVETDVEYSFLIFSTTSGVNEQRSTYYAWYDSTQKYISGGTGAILKEKAPTNAKYVRLSWSATKTIKNPTFAKSALINGYISTSDSMPQYGVTLSNVVKSSNGYAFDIPLYYDEQVKHKIEEINAIEMDSGVDGASYVFITDMHVNANRLLSIPLLERVRANTNAYHCFYGGDSCRAYGSVDDLKNDNEIVMSGLYRVFGKEISYVLGNHDYTICTGSTWGQDMASISTNACYAIYDKKTDVTTKRLYHYWDDAENNIRHIIIDYTLVKAPWFLSWLDEAINSAPSGCLFCFYSHVNVYKPDGSVNSEIDYSHIVDWLTALKNKTSYRKTVTYGAFTHTIDVNYSNTDKDVAYFVSGHWHADYSKKVGGVNYIVTTSDACYNDDASVKREVGNSKENAFDVVHINTKTKKIDFVRIGAGVNRHFTY